MVPSVFELARCRSLVLFSLDAPYTLPGPARPFGPSLSGVVSSAGSLRPTSFRHRPVSSLSNSQQPRERESVAINMASYLSPCRGGFNSICSLRPFLWTTARYTVTNTYPWIAVGPRSPPPIPLPLTPPLDARDVNDIGNPGYRCSSVIRRCFRGTLDMHAGHTWKSFVRYPNSRYKEWTVREEVCRWNESRGSRSRGWGWYRLDSISRIARQWKSRLK